MDADLVGTSTKTEWTLLQNRCQGGSSVSTAVFQVGPDFRFSPIEKDLWESEPKPRVTQAA